jgi:hypothetical protein
MDLPKRSSDIGGCIENYSFSVKNLITMGVASVIWPFLKTMNKNFNSMFELVSCIRFHVGPLAGK